MGSVGNEMDGNGTTKGLAELAAGGAGAAAAVLTDRRGLGVAAIALPASL